MSLQAMTWALGQRIPSPGAKIVLITVAHYADHRTGEAWPSHRAMMEETSLDRRTIQRHLKWLEEEGYLVISEREDRGGRQTSNLYTLRFDRRGGEGGTMPPSPDDNSAAPGGGTMPPSGAAPCRPLNLSKEPLSKEPEERETRGRGAGKGAAEAADHMSDPAFMAAVRAYPTAAGDRLAIAYRVWLCLAEAERRLAVERMAAFIAFRRGQGRTKHLPAFENYLRDKGFLLVGTTEGQGEVSPKVPVDAKKRIWFGLLYGRIFRGERVSFMVAEGIAGRPWFAAPGELPDEAEERALVSIEAGGEEASAWTAHLAGRGVRIAFRDFGMPYVFVPARWPPGHPAQRQTSEDAADLEAGL